MEIRMARRCFLILILLSLYGVAFSQNASLRGTVKNRDTGEPLAGANIQISSATIGRGDVADSNGSFQVTNIPPGTYTITISFIGYERFVRENAIFAAGEIKVITADLVPSGILLGTVSVTASRRPEKTLDAPASISIVEASELRGQVPTSTADVLKNTPAVDIAATGLDRREIVLRGFNNAFSGATFIMTDYRQAAVPSLGVNLHAAMPNLMIDLDRIEVVRGPGSALYGPGVDAGVIHYITKSPFTDPGTIVSLSGGERSFVTGAVRHAKVINENIAYKFTLEYAQGNDWQLDPAASLDSIQLSLDAEGLMRDYDYRKANLTGTVQYRSNGNTTLTATGGTSFFDGIVLTGVGTAQGDGFGYSFGQVRLRSGRLFAQAYINKNEAGDTFLYGDGSILVDKSLQLNAQAQYDMDLSEEQQMILGVDLDITNPDTDGTIYGRNEDDDRVEEFGAYAQSLTRLTPHLDLTLALRGDYNNIQSEFQVSPRVAMVYKPNSQNSFRVTYNRAITSPGNNSLFLDILARPGDELLPIDVRGRGSKDGYTFPRNPAFEPFAGTDLVARSLNPEAPGAAQPVGLFLDDVYQSLYAGLQGIPIEDLKAMLPPPFNTLPDPFLQGLLDAFDPQQTVVNGFTRGTLGTLNISTFMIDPVSGVTDIAPLEPTISQTFEAGYKGLIQERLLFAIDAYYTVKENFVGPVLIETPFVLVPSLSEDLQAALAEGIANNPTLAPALATFGFTSEEAAALIVGIASGELPDATTPIAIVVPNENDLGEGMIPELMGTYKNFGKVSYWGVDASFQFFASENLKLFGNMSLVSDDFFDNDELDEENNPDLRLALNAPSLKLKGGFGYGSPKGYDFGVSGRYVKGFPVFSGPYVGGLPQPYGTGRGGVEDYFLLDLNFGYDLKRIAEGLRFDFAVSNALDNKHREFIGAPQIGRLIMSRLTFKF